MNVKELIQKLQKFDQELPVMIMTTYECERFEILQINVCDDSVYGFDSKDKKNKFIAKRRIVLIEESED